MKIIFKKNNKNENPTFGGETSKCGRLAFVSLLVFIFFVAPIITSASAVKTANKNGLVGYWAFNEGVGTKTGDASGKGINGTVANTTWSSGRFGKALYFNGTDSIVSAPYNSALDLTNNITMSVWYKKDVGSGTNKWLLHKATVNTSYAMFIEGGLKMRLEHPSMQDCLVTEPSEGVWHHAVSTYDGANMKVYVDGVLKNTCAATGNINLTGGGIEIGMFSSPGYYPFKGLIDEVRIYNRALTASEILDLYKAGDGGIIKTIASGKTGLVGYWPMNEGVGTRADDVSGYKNNGTLLNSPTWVTGKLGKALSFNGTNSVVDFGTKFPNITTAITVSAWVNPGSTQMTYADIWGNHQGDVKGIVMQQNAATTNQFLWSYGNGVGWTNNSGTFNLTANTWTHVVAIKDASYCYVYLNGVEQVSARGNCVSDIVPATTMNFSAGLGYAGGGRYFNGKIDDIRVYNRALSASEVSDLYKSGGQVTLNASRNNILTDGLVGLWSFDGKDMNWATNKSLDRSGQGNDGTLVGMSTTSSPVIGKIGQALNFQWSSYVTTTGSTSNGSASVFAWINPSFLGTCPGASPNLCEIVMISSNFLFEVGSGMLSIYGYVFNTPQWVSISNSNISINKWMHVGFTYDQTTLRVYLDGEQIGTANVPGVIGTGGNIKIGGDNNFRLFKGKIDDVRVYNRALSATEIKQLYNLGR